MAEKRRKRVTDAGGGEVEMTPMIDVVFQLLVYFVVTIKPVDVSAHLDVFRPSAKQAPKEVTEPPKMIQIQIFPDGMAMNGRDVNLASLTKILGKLAAISKTQTVVIMCTPESKHDQLINVLDRCARYGLSNLSVMSMH